MSIVTIEYDFYNPRNPKCRACKFYKSDCGIVGDCTKEEFKGNKHRYHNSKACQYFRKKDDL